MKKQKLSVLLLITIAFAAFTLGFFLGRNPEPHPITLSVPDTMQTQPTKAEVIMEQRDATDAAVTFPIDINDATETELRALPGIGEVLAKRILAYRNENGRFSSVEELMLVEGIGEKRVEEIWDFIVIGG